MIQRLRAPLAAFVAVLIGGELALRGVDALTDVWGFLFPYVFLFLLCEVLRARRRLRDEEAFLVGAAVGLLRDGVYAKTLQDGGLPFGVDVLGAATAAFDWGMIAVLSLHVVDALIPRDESENRAFPETAAAALIALAAFGVYVLSTATGRYRYERMLGSEWLAADVLFAGIAAGLMISAWRRAGREEPSDRGRGLWVLAAFCAWLPVAQILARAAVEPAGLVGIFILLTWSAAFGFGVRRLWRERGSIAAAPRHASRPALGLALWRALTIAAIAFSSLDDRRAGASYQIFVDAPSNLMFFWIFFAGRLAV